MGPPPKKRVKGGRLAQELEEIAELERRVVEEAPPLGANPLVDPQGAADEAAAGKGAGKCVGKGAGKGADGEAAADGAAKRWARKFADLPLSHRTLAGLGTAGFTRLTDIQRAAIPHALAGRDVLGAAKTGSGKTLAFVVPLLEKLWRQKWGKQDGCGALVVSPTRELALQIFDVLRAAGSRHELSAGMIIGGKDYSSEASRIGQMAILVCTPGRLLQHMDQTVGFELSQLQLLVLDEADRILDMGFAKTLNAIVKGLPKKRQTLLFSATQTRSVRDLARLSLERPQYIAVHETAASATPEKLEHFYMQVELGAKVDTVWSFVKAHLNSKVLIFTSSCKQCRFLHEAFSALRPGVPLMALHGRQKQMKRLSLYTQFGAAKRAILFATDIAARGLDFAGVDWVLQLDCPEDVPTYIHRTGRTARFRASGKALLLLLPSELPFLPKLTSNRIAPKKLDANPKKLANIETKLQALLSERPELRQLAQKALVSYTRSVMLQADKDVFDVHALPMDKFAASLGLVGVPRVRFLRDGKHGTNWSRAAKHAQAEGEGEEEESDSEGGSEDEGEDDADARARLAPESESEDEVSADEADEEADLAAGKKHRARSKLIRLLDAQRENRSKGKGKGGDSEEEDEDEFLVVKRVLAPEEAEEEEYGAADAFPVDDAKARAMRALAKGKLKVKRAAALASITRFDEEGNEIVDRFAGAEQEGEIGPSAVPAARAQVVSALRERLAAAAPADKATERERVRAKHRVERIKRKKRENGDPGDGEDKAEVSVQLGSGSSDGKSESGSDEEEEGSEEEEKAEGPRGRRARAAASSSEESDDDDDDKSADEPQARRPVKRAAREPSAPAAAKRAKANPKPRKGKAAPSSIADLEAAALRMIDAH